MADPIPPKTLRLRAVGPNSDGARFGLRAGDVLILVNGAAFLGGGAELAALCAGQPVVALTLRRGAVDFTLLSHTPNLGRWEACTPPDDVAPDTRLQPGRLRNWQILRGVGAYDLGPAHIGWLSCLMPPLWLCQLRLWVPASTVLAGMIAAGLVTWWLCALVWLAAVFHIRQSGLSLWLSDRRALGLHPAQVIAARSERDAHRTAALLFPNDRNLFARRKAPVPQTE